MIRNSRPTARSLRRRSVVLALCGLSVLSLATPAPAQDLPIVKPTEVGMAPQRLSAIGDWLRAEVAAKRIPGAVMMVVRGGKLAYLDAVGRRDPASPAPMKTDDLFRIYSMTKPIVSVAAMMLVEDGRLLL